MHMHAYNGSVPFPCMHVFVYMCVHVESLCVRAYIYAQYLLLVNISRCVRMCMAHVSSHVWNFLIHLHEIIMHNYAYCLCEYLVMVVNDTVPPSPGSSRLTQFMRQTDRQKYFVQFL